MRLHPTGKCVHILFLQQKILFIFGNFNCDHDLSLTKPFYFPKLLFCSILLIYKKNNPLCFLSYFSLRHNVSIHTGLDQE